MAIDVALLERGFEEAFDDSAEGGAVAPGRVNLIGEHTDYNDGYVLPMAIDRHLGVAFASRRDRVLRAGSAAFGEVAEIDLDGGGPAAGGWFEYVAAVALTLERAGHRLRGVDLWIEGDVPLGAGLSSSAALELGVARALAASSELQWDAVAMARLCQKAENEIVGVQCGLMDQLASALCEEGAALLIDCRSLELASVALPAKAAVVVMDTGVGRSLAGSEYNQRRAACEAAVAAIAREDPEVRSLRDVTPELLSSMRDGLDRTVYRRAAFVVAENLRPQAFVAALQRDDLVAAGRLMNDSHAGLRDLYEVSCPELDALTEMAREHSGCFGARLSGAGFGGCAIALLEVDQVDDFMAEVERRYRASGAQPGEVFASRPVAGARLLARGRRGALR